jgi:hypothetical protein
MAAWQAQSRRIDTDLTLDAHGARVFACCHRDTPKVGTVGALRMEHGA